MSSQIPQIPDDATYSLPKAIFSILTYSYFFLVFLMLGAFQLNLSHHFSSVKDSVIFDLSVDFGKVDKSPVTLTFLNIYQRINDEWS